MSRRERDTLLQQAQRLRAGQQAVPALAVLARLEAAYPRFSRLYQERGQCQILRGDAPAAFAALEEAVRLNPTLPACWDMLEQLYRLQGDAAGAAAAAAQRNALAQLPPAIVMANSLVADGDLAPAEDVLRDYLRADTGNVGALHLLARIRQERGAAEEAEALLRSVLVLAPDHHAARFEIAVLMLQQQRHREARRAAATLLVDQPEHRDYQKLYAAACIGLGDHEPVVDLYERLAATPQSPAELADLRLWRANALKITGRTGDAIADYHAALAARPDQAVAWFSLANLKTYRFTDAEITTMRAAEARPGIPAMDRTYLCFALGKALEDRKNFPESWSYYARGNALRRASATYRPAVAEACAARIRQTCTAAFFADRAGWGVDDPSPIFVLGLPRSGSTLVEQILASHPEVEGTQELTDISRYARALCGADPDCGLPLNPEGLAQLTAADARALGKRYLAETQTYRQLGHPFFVDKMPDNFWHIGLIQLILPRATIIDTRRDPMACGFSNLKQLFGTNNQEFSYSIDDVARHTRTYWSLMRHWDAVLPGRVLRVSYEDLVADLEGGVRRMLVHADLPFNSACLAFHTNPRSVRTPSSEQVRRPIDRGGLDQWRNYTAWLAPLRAALTKD